MSTLNEMESKITTLERANFDLKMRLHYLNKKFVAQQPPDSPAGHNFSQSTILHPGGENSSFHLLEDASVDILTMREENDALKRRVHEMETQYLQLQLLRDHDQSEHQRLLNANHKLNTSIQVEETRKREREVALAIAEHDAVLIQKLQEENASLHQQLQLERSCTTSVTDELAIVKASLLQKTKENEEYQQKQQELMIEIGVLKDRMQLFQLQNSPLLPLTTTSNANTAPPNSPMVFAAASNGQQTSIFINGQPSSSFTMSANPQQTSFNIDHQSHHSQPLHNYLTNHPHHNHSNVNDTFNSSQVEVLGEIPHYHNNNHQVKPSLDQSTSQPHGIHQENELLKFRLQKLQQSIENQDTIIKMLKNSTQEISMIEGHEMKRLQQELERSNEEKERLRQRYQKLEVDLEVSRQEVQHIKQSHDTSSAAMTLYQSPSSSVIGLNKSEEGRDVYERTIDLYK